jgi:hypothetical protein
LLEELEPLAPAPLDPGLPELVVVAFEDPKVELGRMEG